jgi:hypothetical protein
MMERWRDQKESEERNKKKEAEAKKEGHYPNDGHPECEVLPEIWDDVLWWHMQAFEVKELTDAEVEAIARFYGSPIDIGNAQSKMRDLTNKYDSDGNGVVDGTEQTNFTDDDKKAWNDAQEALSLADNIRYNTDFALFMYTKDGGIECVAHKYKGQPVKVSLNGYQALQDFGRNTSGSDLYARNYTGKNIELYLFGNNGNENNMIKFFIGADNRLNCTYIEFNGLEKYHFGLTGGNGWLYRCGGSLEFDGGSKLEKFFRYLASQISWNQIQAYSKYSRRIL